MREVTIAYKAFDPHELGCHAVAAGLGLYEEAEVRPRLLDGTFTPDDALGPDTLSAACGAALVARARGAAVRIAFVACARPMFRLYGAGDDAGPRDVASLAGRPVATFPAVAPPATLLAAALRARGVGDVDPRPCRDDASRLGLLRAGDVDAALLSSAVWPGPLPGVGPLLLDLGDELAGLPTTGLAAAETADAELVAAVVGAHAGALRALRERPDDAAAALGAAFGLGAGEAAETRALLAERFTAAGRLDAAAFAGAAGQVAELGGLAAYDVAWAPLA